MVSSRAISGAVKELEQERDAYARYLMEEKDINDELFAENERLRELLAEVGGAGVAFEDERVDYVEIQIDRETWEAIKAVA